MSAAVVVAPRSREPPQTPTPSSNTLPDPRILHWLGTISPGQRLSPGDVRLLWKARCALSTALQGEENLSPTQSYVKNRLDVSARRSALSPGLRRVSRRPVPILLSPRRKRGPSSEPGLRGKEPSTSARSVRSARSARHGELERESLALPEGADSARASKRVSRNKLSNDPDGKRRTSIW